MVWWLRWLRKQRLVWRLRQPRLVWRLRWLVQWWWTPRFWQPGLVRRIRWPRHVRRRCLTPSASGLTSVYIHSSDLCGCFRGGTNIKHYEEKKLQERAWKWLPCLIKCK
uniref:Secreted protein n=1 Tax=Rhipicephalus appendiculatus TaxID=34631 RepID=A0A131YD16_RHIAP